MALVLHLAFAIHHEQRGVFLFLYFFLLLRIIFFILAF